MKKKTWIKPELIVLVRSKPEEAILRACKTWTGTIGNANWFNHCDAYGDPSCNYCVDSAIS